MSQVYIIMGVSGSGKTTIGSLLAQRLELPFYDADDFHPEASVKKMQGGQPLTDSDRQPWLKQLNTEISKWNTEKGAVLACSALKESYRNTLTTDHQVSWIVLRGDHTTILNRMQDREHFMPTSLLQSQFETLELPPYGIHVDIDNTPEVLVNYVLENLNKAEFGILGLGVMGSNLALNCMDKGLSIAVYNRNTPGEERLLSDFLASASSSKVKGFDELKAFTVALARPRRIVMMVAASAVDVVIDEIQPLLDPGDLLIDGGNSYYKDTERRADKLSHRKINYLGLGISGGASGARNGPSLMAGGSETAYTNLKVILQSISAKGSNGRPCVNLVGPKSAGHFVKMVHNGIEYAEMQLLAEVYALLSSTMSPEQLAQLFETWNQGALNSYLLEITAKIITKKDSEGYLLDTILDSASGKGTGVWTGKTALELGATASMTQEAVNARFVSMLKEQRTRLSELRKAADPLTIDPVVVQGAYTFARHINHYQGFTLMRVASETYGWNMDLPEIACIWTNGCIIRSKLMETISQQLSDGVDLLVHPEYRLQLTENESAVKSVINASIENNIPLPCHSTALQYWLQLNTGKSPANLIQAQRDFFGSHGYQRVDKPSDQTFTSNWTHG